MRNIGSILTPPSGLSTGDPNVGLEGTGLSGPRGIEAVLEYNGIYLNIRSWIDTYLVTTIGGLDDADVRDSRDVNPGYHGETAFPGYYGGRTVTLTGKVYTKTLFKLRDMQQGLRQAFSGLAVELPLIFRANDPDLDMMLYCRKSQPIQMADEQRTANHFERPFLVTLRASNPRFLGYKRLRKNIFFTGATFDGIVFNVDNLGNFRAQPDIELTGPIATGLKIINEANNETIMLTAPVPTGEKWIISIENQRMYRDSDNANRFQYLDTNSDWTELEPDRNPIHVIAAGLTGASQIVMYWRHTVM